MTLVSAVPKGTVFFFSLHEPLTLAQVVDCIKPRNKIFDNTCLTRTRGKILSMTVKRYVAASTKAQGLPTKVHSQSILCRIAVLIPSK